MKEPTLRLAAPGDIAALLALQSAYYAEDRYAFVESIAREVWHSLLSDASLGSAWVFEADATLVGYVVLTLGYSLEYRGRDAFLDEVYVTPDWRGRGLGRRALEAVDSACSRLGVNALHLEVENDKSGAIALYQKWGFAENGRVLMTKQVTSLGKRGLG